MIRAQDAFLSRDAMVLRHTVFACNDIDIELLFGFLGISTG